MKEDMSKMKVVGVIDEESKEEVMLIWKISLVARKFNLIGQLARVDEDEK